MSQMLPLFLNKTMQSAYTSSMLRLVRKFSASPTSHPKRICHSHENTANAVATKQIVSHHIQNIANSLHIQEDRTSTKCCAYRVKGNSPPTPKYTLCTQVHLHSGRLQGLWRTVNAPGGSAPTPPLINENPSPTHSGKWGESRCPRWMILIHLCLDIFFPFSLFLIHRFIHSAWF